MNETTTAAGPDRGAIRAELQATDTAYRQLVGQIGDANWKLRSGNAAWTCGQLAWHLASGTGFIAGQIEAGIRGKAMNPPALLSPLLFKASELRVRIASRKATPASVLADFDAGMKRLQALLNATDDQTLLISATLFGETRTVAGMFGIPASHFAEHSARRSEGPRRLVAGVTGAAAGVRSHGARYDGRTRAPLGSSRGAGSPSTRSG